VNPEIFAEWMRRQGHHVVRTTSSYWYDAGPRVFQAFPYDWLIQPATSELRKLMIGHGVVALRYSTPLEVPSGTVSYHVVLTEPYGLQTLRAQARNGVRRGLECCNIVGLSFERLAEEGWNLQQDTLDRQGRIGSMTRSEWQRICRAADGLPGFEAWGAIIDGELAASVLIARINDTYDVPYALSHRKFLSKHVNNALFYTVSRELLSRPGVQEIFFCLHSLDAPESVDEFKFRMGLQAKPVRQRIVFHPLLAPFAKEGAHSIIARLLVQHPGSRVLAKAEGMLRFYLQEKSPAEAQNWPECLSSRKQELLQSLSSPGSSSNEPGAARQESQPLMADEALDSNNPSKTLVARRQ
jgi:hypothetical protein